nr:hypothetical protein [Tanacetum cinerariifolium]
MSCHLEDHVRRLSPRKTQYLEVDRRVAGQPAPSASESEVEEVVRMISSTYSRSQRAWKGDLEIGEEVVTCKVYLRLAFVILTLKHVTIGCCEVGGEVVGGVGVVCSDGVDSGVGGVDCGVVCGFVCGVVCGSVC